MVYSDKSLQVAKLADAYRLLPPLTDQQQRHQREVDRLALTWSSTALAGNQLTLEETRRVLTEDIAVGGKPLSHHVEILGHSEAFNMLYLLARLEGLESTHVCALHQLYSYRLDAEHAGKFRTDHLTISETSFMPPSPAEIPTALNALIDQSEQQRQQNPPLVYAAWLHNQCMAIHPFATANDIVARLLLNLALLQCGYPMAVIAPQQRDAYLSALRAAHNGDHQPFINLLSHQLVIALEKRLHQASS
ncbi:Fic family protein [Desulfuromonas acetoxidans]|uniref:Fic family protein n=1 Tax=Desulfuromonas acetoxidans TaxID=891 RepID=UPI00292E78CE|nr:Fic family protein [Desulfuromonas acetoxidans]